MACQKINHNIYIYILYIYNSYSLPLIFPWEHLCKVVHRGETEEARGGRRDAPGLRSDQSDAKKQAAWPSGWLITQEKRMIEPWTCPTMKMSDLTMNMLDVAWFDRLNMTNVDSTFYMIQTNRDELVNSYSLLITWSCPKMTWGEETKLMERGRHIFSKWLGDGLRLLFKGLQWLAFVFVFSLASRAGN